jgi:hypothetical protein
MELQFPADAHDALVSSGRNISDTKRWVSVWPTIGFARRRVRLPGPCYDPLRRLFAAG